MLLSVCGINNSSNELLTPTIHLIVLSEPPLFKTFQLVGNRCPHHSELRDLNPSLPSLSLCVSLQPGCTLLPVNHFLKLLSLHEYETGTQAVRTRAWALAAQEVLPSVFNRSIKKQEGGKI